MKASRRWPPPKGGKQGSIAAHAPLQAVKQETGQHDNGDIYGKAEGASDRDRPSPVSPAALAAAASVVAAAAAASSSSSPMKTHLRGTRADGEAKAANDRATTETATSGPAPPPTTVTGAPVSVPNVPAHFPVQFGEPNGGKVASPLLLRGSARRTKKYGGVQSAAASAAAVGTGTAVVTATASNRTTDNVNPETSGKGNGGGAVGGAVGAPGVSTTATKKEPRWPERRSLRVSAAPAVPRYNDRT